MNFWKSFKPKSCSVHLRAQSKSEALSEVVENLISGATLPEQFRADALEALLAREKLGSTGVGMGVAIPHVKLKGIERAACSLSVHAGGLDWQALDGGQVHILFTVLRPEKAGGEHDPERHLEMMHWIARLAREADFRRFALKVKTKTELVDLLKEMSAA
jgi:mannitol/fructose-specific phosphotransferase system IIA component (Ntr-type)